MSTFFKTFFRRKVPLPVIHVEDVVQTKRNAGIAFGEGAPGIFLICHKPEMHSERLKRIYEEVRATYPTQWIGLNFLDLQPEEAIFFAPPSASGIWEDHVGITDSDGSVGFAATLADLHARKQATGEYRGLYFGGVAFKYRTKIDNPAAAARRAMPYLDVITTSGESTGSAPDLEKIKSMRGAIGTHPLAIASGMTPENVGLFAEYADCFLVATGISDSFTELNPKKVRDFVKVLQSFG